jgi:Hsp70 protein
MGLDESGMAHYLVNVSNEWRKVTPEEVGTQILMTLRRTAERNLTVPATLAVMAVPAEFDTRQRNFTRQAAKRAGQYTLLILSYFVPVLQSYKLLNKYKASSITCVPRIAPCTSHVFNLCIFQLLSILYEFWQLITWVLAHRSVLTKHI